MSWLDALKKLVFGEPKTQTPGDGSKKSKKKDDRVVVLVRDEVTKSYIRGTLSTADSTYQILERPWLNNERNASCIPPGEYTANFLERSSSGKYKRVFHLTPVTGRSGILIHNGNTVDHTKGCLIIGLRRGILANKPAVLNSRTALAMLVDEMGEEKFTLRIVGNQTIKD